MSARERMIRVYDRLMRGSYARRYYEGSGFFNFGYWAAKTATQRQACEALVDELVGRIALPGGRILDVACGLGASTQRLTQTYPPERITAINISEAQLAAGRERAPGCKFLMMDATRLDFPDNHFDAVICVEAAFHFDTRDKFLAEAFRVLKPGGSLVLSDILFRSLPGAILDAVHAPAANAVATVADYRQRLAAAGFATNEVIDATDPCRDGFRRNLAGWAHGEYRAGRFKLTRSLGAGLVFKLLAAYAGLVCKTYLIVSARKASE